MSQLPAAVNIGDGHMFPHTSDGDPGAGASVKDESECVMMTPDFRHRHGPSKAILVQTTPLSSHQLYIQFAMCRLRIASYYATTGKSLHSTCPSKSRKGLVL